jgi:DNA-binding GntR family transcriptional regulator
MNADFGNGFALAPLDRPGPLRSQVRDALIELIISRELAPGKHLVEADIAGQLQVSRQPVREALQALQSDGWVDLRQGRGAFVHDPTVAEVDEVFAVRTLLEQQSAGLAARNATAADVDVLRTICDQGRATLTDGDADRLVLLNASFHRQVSELSGNRILGEFIASLDRRVRWYFTEIAMTRGAVSWDEHDELCDALATNDSVRAAQVMNAHTAHSQRAYHERRQNGQEQPNR